MDGRLDVLKWVRDQDPPCPWSRGECREEASHNGHDHIVDWIDQQEDESDCDSEEQREREREREITMEEMLFPDDDGDYDSDGSYDSYSDEYF